MRKSKESKEKISIIRKKVNQSKVEVEEILQSAKSKVDKVQEAINVTLMELQKEEEIEKQSLIEEQEKVDKIKNNINEICKKENLFCGIILTSDNIAEIVKLAINSKENITIPFALYFND